MLKTILSFTAAATLAIAAPCHAQELLGSSLTDMQALMPVDSRPANISADGETVEYRDVSFGDTQRSGVVMHFDPEQHLSSMSFRSTTMGFDELKTRAQAQYDSYMSGEMKAFLTSGTPFHPMQVRICEQAGGGVVMTFEQPKEAL